MLQSSSKLPAPGRLFLPGCAIAAGLLAVSSPVIAAPTLKSRPKAALVKVAKFPSVKAVSAKVADLQSDESMKLRVGKTAIYPLAAQTRFTPVDGAQFVFCEVKDGTLTVKALAPGDVRIRLDIPKQGAKFINLSLVDPVASVEQRNFSQVVERAPADGAIVAPPVAIAPAPGVPSTALADTPTAPAVADPSVSAPVPVPAPESPTASTTSEMTPQSSNAAPLTPSSLSTDLSGDTAVPAPAAPALPGLTPPVINTPTTTTTTTAPARGPQISPILPAPARGKNAKVGYRTAPKLPSGVSAAGHQGIAVTQGLARLLSFPSNILAVFFSDPTVMDARAINARTIAVTGVGSGTSTLAVFTSQFPGDAVGKASIYRIQTTPRAGAAAVPAGDPRVMETAIASALGDPRIRTSVISLPDGTLAARLAGTVRNAAEVEAAVTTASFFVPRVISSLYADVNAPTLDAVLSSGYNATPESGLQENLRKISGNQTIELVPLPTGLGFKAEVDSPEEAESLLRLLPSLNQQIIPFIVVHGQPSGTVYNATVPLLNGEDRQLTQKLQDVTGIRTVYAVRTASNSLAAYGNVRTRSEYDEVRRYMMIAAQSSNPPAVQGTTQGGQSLRPQGDEGSSQASYNPAGGYRQNLGLQMFVKITDPGQSVIRKVTVETNIVEINRTSLKNLGAQYGSVNVLSETTTAGTQTLAGNGAILTTPGTTTRTIDPTFQSGLALAGNGFIGGAGTGFINPFRVQLNALVTAGDARILSSPNVTSVEGSPAQITIGGERPVPKVVATQGAVGTQVEFRRYGVIISMRPTVTGENTILLQIRADVTQPDRTYEINLNGALIPGETVRSIDTVLNVRPGDTIVMGGLMTNNNRQQTSKVPILGDLPIIGSLFKSKNFENNITELAIFMTPHIDSMPADMGSIEALNAAPSFPSLPSRQDSSAILFQETTRQQN